MSRRLSQNVVLDLMEWKVAVGMGTFMLGMGLLFGVVIPWMTWQDSARAARLPVINATALSDTPPGREVLVEGRVSARSPARFREFVAYIRDEYQGEDSDGDDRWVEDERMTPPLWLELPDGAVQIDDASYDLYEDLTRWQTDNVLNWNSRSGEGTKRYRGLVADAPVVVIGTAQRGAEGITIDAELIAGGTRDSYLGGLRTLTRVMIIVGGIISLVGAPLLIGGVLRYRRR